MAFPIDAVIAMYTVDHLTMQQIADKIGFSKRATKNDSAILHSRTHE